MRRWMTLAAIAAAICAHPAHGQRVDFGLLGDSVFAIEPGETGSVVLEVCCSNFVSQYDVTIFFDDTRITLVSADSVPGSGLDAPAVVTGVDQATITAGNIYGPTVGAPFPLARLTFMMDAAAPTGSLVSMRLNTLLDLIGADLLPTQRTGLVDVCIGDGVFGDLDADNLTNSRDGLIALTHSVGLPIGAFDGTLGDVDSDGHTTSRDALFILAESIGQDTIVGFPNTRIGRGRAVTCPPADPNPGDMLFIRTDFSAGFQDTYKVVRILPGDTIGTEIPFTETMPDRPEWAPDQSRIVFGINTAGFGREIATMNPDGTGVDTLTRNIALDFHPTWSPDGTQIAFLSQRVSPAALFIMDADGSNQTQVTFGFTVIQPSWRPGGTHVGFTGYQVCCTPRLWVMDVATQLVTEAFPNSSASFPRDPSWSPDGAHLIFRAGAGSVDSVAFGGAGTPGKLSRLDRGEYPWWLPAGQVFWSDLRLRAWYFKRDSDDRILRIHRRSPGSNGSRVTYPLVSPVHVDVVAIGQPTGTQVQVGMTTQLTATVTNSDLSPNATVPITWISRDLTLAAVDQAGLVTADPVNTGLAWIVAHVRGWRADSIQVDVIP